MVFEPANQRVFAGLLEPLSVEGSELRRAEVLRCAQEARVHGPGARFGQPFPFGEKPLQDLNVRQAPNSAARCSRAACW